MHINEDCYIAFIDILGFKKLIMSNTTSDILKLFNKIVATRKNIYKHNSNIDTEWNTMLSLTAIRIMSDSIVIAIPSRFPNSLAFVADCCRWIQSSLLSKNILVRGGISKGMFYINNEIMFGDGLVKAYSLEGYAQYPRIIISPDIVHNYDKIYGTSTEIYLTDFIIFDNDYYYINYLMCITNYKPIRNFILTEIEKESNNPEIKAKYLWLKDYFNKTINNPVYEADINLYINNDITIGR